MECKTKLSLEEILQLASRITNWRKQGPALDLSKNSFFLPSGRTTWYVSSIKNIRLSVSERQYVFRRFLYVISATCDCMSLGEYKTRDDLRIIGAFKDAKLKFELRVKQKKQQKYSESLSYAKNLLKKKKKKKKIE